MATVHAWFSPEEALLHGSAIYRKPGGSTVNVTRISQERKDAGAWRQDEKYLGEVISAEDGGCVHPTQRVAGIANG